MKSMKTLPAYSNLSENNLKIAYPLSCHGFKKKMNGREKTATF